MSLVDLRGREADDALASFLPLAACSPASPGTPVGWERDGRLVACAQVARDGDDLDLRSIAAAPGEDAAGCALVEALAETVNAQRLAAETDEDGAAFFAACGFEVTPGDGRFRCVRVLDAEPAHAAARALTLAEIETAVAAAWSAETADDPDSWSPENPARNHCDVTALMVRELLGGEILIANVVRDGRRLERHAWNRLPSGVEVDLTRSQFRDGEQFGPAQVGEPRLGRTDERFETFAARVRTTLELAPGRDMMGPPGFEPGTNGL